MSDNFKEFTFPKQIERTAKHDAYEMVLCWARSENVSKADIIWYLEMKVAGHKEYLNKLPLEYNYATQTLCAKRSYTITTSETADDQGAIK